MIKRLSKGLLYFNGWFTSFNALKYITHWVISLSQWKNDGPVKVEEIRLENLECLINVSQQITLKLPLL